MMPVVVVVTVLFLVVFIYVYNKKQINGFLNGTVYMSVNPEYFNPAD
ncbi:hypothetical protein chiPu_0033462, partial [Chiloscyllium punctatum]|nr:hypothetical protein [Chiloscyllium punctatum]